MNWLERLNEQQKKAVMHPSGPLFVVAGAGTGKTRTLTSRVAYLIEHMNVNPGSILAVTFTNKAAREMKERLLDLVGPYAENVWIYTFHAFGVQVLRKEIEKLNLGYNTKFNIIDEDDAKSIVKEAIKALNLDSKRYKSTELRNKISAYKHFKQDYFNDDYERNIYQKYQSELLANNLLDFDDLQVYTHKLLKENFEVRSYYRSLFEHILVDEFQDTDNLQYEILSFLMKDNGNQNLFVVGDPDQSIYSFRGANYENARRFLTDFKNEENQTTLDLNYRSTNQILEYANRLIKNNQNRPAKKNLNSELGQGIEPVFATTNTDYQEAFMVADEIIRLINDGYNYSEIAILYRTNALSRIYEDVLIRSNIPYIIYGGMSFYHRREIKDILAYIRLLVNPSLDFYFKRIINVPRRAIGQTTVNNLIAHAKLVNTSLFRGIETFSASNKVKTQLTDFISLIEGLQEYLYQIDDIGHIVMEVASKTGYLQMLEAENDDVALDRIENIKELVSIFKQGNQFYEGTSHEKLQQLLDQIALYTELDKVDGDNAVILSTYHQVKGLEFKTVFMVAMEDGIFPSMRSFFDIKDLEEERRIAYVGITRARERLYLTKSNQRMLYGTTNNHLPSRFINEARPKEEQKTISTKPLDKVITNLLDKGEKVKHEIFGEGLVISVDNEIATIAFAYPHGIKKLLENHPAIKKIF